MKLLIITLLLLPGIASHAQVFTFKGDSLTGQIIPFDNGRDTVKEQYDTVKIIATVYELPYKRQTGAGIVLQGPHKGELIYDSTWSWDSTRAQIHDGILAWNVYYKKGGWTAVKPIKTLAYNKKDTLSHVLQSWRIDW